MTAVQHMPQMKMEPTAEPDQIEIVKNVVKTEMQTDMRGHGGPLGGPLSWPPAMPPSGSLPPGAVLGGAVLPGQSDPLKDMQNNVARMSHANTLSVMINNTAHVFSSRVSADILKSLKEQEATGRTPSVPSALRQIKKFLQEGTNLFRFGAVEAIGLMKGVTDGTMKCLFEVFKSNPHLSVKDVKAPLEQMLLGEGWAPMLKQVPDDLCKACSAFLLGEALKSFIDVRGFNDGELAPWLDGKSDLQKRTPEEAEVYKMNCERYESEVKKAIDMQKAAQEMMPGVDPMLAVSHSGQSKLPVIPPVNPGFGHIVPGLRLSKPRKRLRNYSQRYYNPKRRQKNPNPRRVCRAIWQDDGVTRGCLANSHPRTVCDCWKLRGFTKADLKSGKITAWLNMAYPGNNYQM